MMSRFFVTLAALVVSNASLAMSSDEPIIIRETPPHVDIVQYPQGSDGYLEAWEIVPDWADGIYLNYSRFPFGDVEYNGKPTIICFANVDGRKFAGMSEYADRLTKSLTVVIKDQTEKSSPVTCQEYSTLLKAHPEYSDLKVFFESL